MGCRALWGKKVRETEKKVQSVAKAGGEGRVISNFRENQSLVCRVLSDRKTLDLVLCEMSSHWSVARGIFFKASLIVTSFS